MTTAMPLSRRTLGVVVVHRPGRAVADLPAVRDLAPQVDELLIVCNGHSGETAGDGVGLDAGLTARVISFGANRGTAAAWNVALSSARDRNFRYLYLLDQDSVPGPRAVRTAQEQIGVEGVAAVVQPAARSRFGLLRFPWNTVASGSLYDVDALSGLGGFDERLFVDEVDHEMLARLMDAGHGVRPLPEATIAHHVGTPRTIRVLGLRGSTLGHSVERHRIRGHSNGMLIRRYIREAPATSAGLLLRDIVIAAKDVAAGEGASARALLSGMVAGVATGQPPLRAAERSCPYCQGPLIGRFGAVPDWRFGTGAPADVYRCSNCGALAAGRSPDVAQVASWYLDYYTHAVQPAPSRVWRRLWPTPRRRREMRRLDWYFTPAVPAGRFLEVGAGSGERLVQFADAGWEVVGQDIDPKAGQLARERGIRVHQCPVADLVGQEGPFDLVGLSHVLEHATDPGEMLRACAALLGPDGRICVISPNAEALGRRLFGRWWFGLEQPRHLAIPTLESLERLTMRLGLQTEHAQSMATNGAVILGGSFSRPLQEHLPAVLRRGVRSSTAFLGQAVGRVAIRLDRRLGEEVVWVGGRPGRDLPSGPAAHGGEADGAGEVQSGIVGV